MCTRRSSKANIHVGSTEEARNSISIDGNNIKYELCIFIYRFSFFFLPLFAFGSLLIHISCHFISFDIILVAFWSAVCVRECVAIHESFWQKF